MTGFSYQQVLLLLLDIKFKRHGSFSVCMVLFVWKKQISSLFNNGKNGTFSLLSCLEPCTVANKNLAHARRSL